MYISNEQPMYEASSKDNTQDYPQIINESEYSSKQQSKYIQEQEYSDQQYFKNQSLDQHYKRHKQIYSHNKEDQLQSSKNEKSSSSHHTDDSNKVKYYSGKEYRDKSLDYNGTYHKLQTSIKDRTIKDLDKLGIEKTYNDSMGSPISYQTHGFEQDSVNYYQMKETKGRSTFERHSNE
jgi:hypothetical protein